MNISKTIDMLRDAEEKCLMNALKAKGGHYKWPESNEEIEKPWATIYMNDGEWHEVEITEVSCPAGAHDDLYVEIIGQDYAGGDPIDIERRICRGEIALGDCYEIASHIA